MRRPGEVGKDQHCCLTVDVSGDRFGHSIRITSTSGRPLGPIEYTQARAEVLTGPISSTTTRAERGDHASVAGLDVGPDEADGR
jgi:hypothetical protein